MPERPAHYFTTEPEGPERRRTLEVELAGRRVGVQTASGVFSGDRIDLGTSVLLREAPDPPPQGHLLDLGCGWGPLALTLALRSRAATVYGVDVNRRALRLLADNATLLGLDGLRAYAPQEVPDVGLDLIWSNPPIRVGKSVLHELLLSWLPRLVPGGSAYLVVQRNLGSDSLHAWLEGALPQDFEVWRHASAKGFRVLGIQRPETPAVA